MLRETHLNLNRAELPSGIAERQRRKSERALASLAPLFTFQPMHPPPTRQAHTRTVDTGTRT
jgi:hypothetical protein